MHAKQRRKISGNDTVTAKVPTDTSTLVCIFHREQKHPSCVDSIRKIQHKTHKKKMKQITDYAVPPTKLNKTILRRKQILEQEIWANPHEMCNSISLISYAGCLGISVLSPVILAKIHSLNVLRILKSQKITKTCYFSISRLFKVINVGTPGKGVSSACYDKIWCPRMENSLNLGVKTYTIKIYV